MDMKDLVKKAFRDTVKFLPQEFKLMPLSRWNESVLRYHFCRFLAGSSHRVEQRVECGHIDLVLRDSSNSAFVEFKLYLHTPKFDPYGPYGAKPLGYKGGPGKKNLAEFQMCVDKLHERIRPGPPIPKYIVLVYADPSDRGKQNLTYARDYDDYRHKDSSVPIRPVESEGLVNARLYEVDGLSLGARTVLR
jgi:hypothetical protein